MSYTASIDYTMTDPERKLLSSLSCISFVTSLKQAFQTAFANDYLAVIEYILTNKLERRHEFMPQDEPNNHILICAIRKNRIKLIQLLFSFNELLDLSQFHRQSNPMREAIATNSITVAQMLLNYYGPSVIDIRDINGNSPLNHVMADPIPRCGKDILFSIDHRHLIRFLVQGGADLNSVNDEGLTPFMSAGTSGLLPEMKLLSFYGVTTNEDEARQLHAKSLTAIETVAQDPMQSADHLAYVSERVMGISQLIEDMTQLKRRNWSLPGLHTRLRDQYVTDFVKDTALASRAIDTENFTIEANLHSMVAKDEQLHALTSILHRQILPELKPCILNLLRPFIVAQNLSEKFHDLLELLNADAPSYQTCPYPCSAQPLSLFTKFKVENRYSGQSRFSNSEVIASTGDGNRPLRDTARYTCDSRTPRACP